MYPLCQSNPFAIKIAKGFLNGAEQASHTREGKNHGPEIPKDLVLVFDADPPLVGGDGG